MREKIAIVMAVGFLTGCVPTTQPKPSIGIGTGIGIPSQTNTSVGTTIGTTIGTPIGTSPQPISAYGVKPRNYQQSIKDYFSSKLTRGEQGRYKFGLPKRAYKRKGLAYGGALSWKGWLVETSVALPTRTGRYLTPKPYMVLFKGEQIVEHILGNSHKLLTKVD